MDFLVGFKPSTWSSTTAPLTIRRTTGKAAYTELGSTIPAVHLVDATDVVTLVTAGGRAPSLPLTGTSEYGVYITDVTGATQGALVALLGQVENTSGTVNEASSPPISVAIGSAAGQYVKLSVANDINYRRGIVQGVSGDAKVGGNGLADPFGSATNESQVNVMWMTINRPDPYAITSVNGGTDTAAIGSTVPVVVSGFPTAVNAGTIDGISLLAASSTSITIAGFVDGAMAPRVGAARPLVLTNGTVSGTRNITVNSPAGFTSVEILAGFNTGEEDSIVYNFDPPMAAGRLIFFVPTKGTVYSNAGYSGSFTGTQLMWDYDPATKIARSFYVITGADGEVISVVRTLHSSLIKGNFLKGNYLKGNVL